MKKSETNLQHSRQKVMKAMLYSNLIYLNQAKRNKNNIRKIYTKHKDKKDSRTL